MTETEIAEVVISWLETQHWDVYQEVESSRGSEIIDIVAVRCNIVWAIEAKRSLGLSVLAQAKRHRTHRRSVAVLDARRSKARDFAYQVAEDYGIGVLLVRKRHITEIVHAPLLCAYHRDAKRLQATLNPQMKVWAKAGNADGKRWTPYAQTISDVRDFITGHPGCILKEIMEYVGRGHYSSERTARSCIRTALSNWESVWCRVETDSSPYRYFVRSDAAP